MTKKNNGLTGQGLAHPENEQQFNFADLIPVISGVIGRQSTSEVNNSQSSAAKRTLFQQDISLKNAHGASGWKAGNIAFTACVVFSRCLLVVIDTTGERPEKAGEAFGTSAEKYAVRTFLESIKKGADCGHALWKKHTIRLNHRCFPQLNRFNEPLFICKVSVCDRTEDYAFAVFAINADRERIILLTFKTNFMRGESFLDQFFCIIMADCIFHINYFSPFNCLASCCAMPTSSLRWSPACTPISPMRSSASSAPLRLVKSLSSPFSLSWRREISPCTAATMKPALLSSFDFTFSIPETTSWGILTVNSCDFEFLLAVDITETPSMRCVSVYAKMKYIKDLTCVSCKFKVKHTLSTSRTQLKHKNSEARRCYQHQRASDHNPNHRSKNHG